MSVLLLGKNGQVGWELQRMLAPFPQTIALDRAALDVTDTAALRHAIREHRPTVLINASAYTAVDRAETEPHLAMTVNQEAVAVMAEEMRRQDGWLVHYSTDYVFDGLLNRPYREDDTAHPLNNYGKSKWLGEEAIRASQVKHLLFRTSWVYGRHGHNFAKTILQKAAAKNVLHVVADQWGAPTHAALIADVTANIVEGLLAGRATPCGTYHLTAAGDTSWHAFAQFLVTEACAHDAALACTASHIHAMTTAEYPTAAQRPRNSRMETTKLQAQFHITLPPWQHHAGAFVAEYVASTSPHMRDAHGL